MPDSGYRQRLHNFNPHPRKEGDSHASEKGYEKFISIHSLVKRETRFSACIFVRSAISIHSLVKRETWLLRCWFVNNINFNPLPRKEGDSYQHVQGQFNVISIHSLVKRETQKRAIQCCSLKDFNPLPRKEGDGLGCRWYAQRLNFNPLPRKEGDKSRHIPFCGLKNFNPLPRKEGDGDWDEGFAIGIEISIHSLVKRETPAIAFLMEEEWFQSTPS